MLPERVLGSILVYSDAEGPNLIGGFESEAFPMFDSQERDTEKRECVYGFSD